MHHDGELMLESNSLEPIKSLVAKGELQEAEVTLRLSLHVRPISDEACMLMTDILIRQAKYEQAAQFVCEQSENVDSFIRLRDYLVGERMNDKALNLIAASRSNDPSILHVNDAIRKQLSGDLQGAINSCHNALKFNANDASAHNQLGRVLFNARQTAQSQSVFEKAITIKPLFAEAWHNLGHVLRSQNKLDDAEKSYLRSVEISPYYQSGLFNLGIVRLARAKNVEALIVFQQLLRFNPNHVEALINAGICEHIARNIPEAKLHYQQAIALDPKSALALHQLANLFADELDTESAIDYFRKSLAVDPRASDVWAELIELHERSNQLNDAQMLLNQAGQNLPNNPNLAYVSAKLARRNNQIEQSVSSFKKIDVRQLHPRFLQAYYFEFAATLDRAGEYGLAFQNFEKGNQLASQTIRAKQTDFSALDRHMDAVEEWLNSGARIGEFHKDEDLGEDLCFLLGFPRSGTTLLDVMLDGHPQTQTLEERATFEHIAFNIDKNYGGYPFGISTINASQRAHLRKQYRNILEKEGIKPNPSGIIIDKMPIRTIDVACIHRLFPRAKFLFSVRHPCDVILSNFMQNFSANEAFVHFNTIAESARIYERVMRIWKTSSQLMPIPFHIVRYESLVTHTERTLQETCRFLGLPWIESINSHQQTLKDRERIKTNSYHQVAEPVYARAVNRWQHYRQQFEPHLAKLKPYADYFSYSLD
jgi:tetratricopeptide (TPR) repeat protein